MKSYSALLPPPPLPPSPTLLPPAAAMAEPVLLPPSALSLLPLADCEQPPPPPLLPPRRCLPSREDLTAEPASETDPASADVAVATAEAPSALDEPQARLWRSSSWMRAMTPTKRAWKASPFCVLAICCTSAMTMETIACYALDIFNDPVLIEFSAMQHRCAVGARCSIVNTEYESKVRVRRLMHQNTPNRTYLVVRVVARKVRGEQLRKRCLSDAHARAGAAGVRRQVLLLLLLQLRRLLLALLRRRLALRTAFLQLAWPALSLRGNICAQWSHPKPVSFEDHIHQANSKAWSEQSWPFTVQSRGTSAEPSWSKCTSMYVL